jgi:hypothetical protein
MGEYLPSKHEALTSNSVPQKKKKKKKEKKEIEAQAFYLKLW